MEIKLLTNSQKRFAPNERRLIKNFFRALFLEAGKCNVHVPGKNEFDRVCIEIMLELLPDYDVTLLRSDIPEYDLAVAYSEYVLPKKQPNCKILFIYSE